MYERDLLVSFIAFALGFIMISSALMNYERAFEMRTPKFLSDTIGRQGARLVMGFVGLIVVLLGAYILCSPYLLKDSSGSRSVEDKHWSYDGLNQAILAESH